MPHMGVHPVPAAPLHPPLPDGMIGLIIGRGALTAQGLIVHPGIIDNHHIPDIQILCSSPQGVFSIHKGDRIAQLVLLPAKDQISQDIKGPMGSTGTDSAYLTVALNTRPKLTLRINGKSFEGILDTGDDKSIISTHWWPKSWAVTQSSHSLQGLGYQSSPDISSSALTWESSEGLRGQFTPYVLPLPVNLWGRDILTEMGLTLTNNYSPSVRNMMEKMGFQEGRGLGRLEQGNPRPISPRPHEGKTGLGFFLSATEAARPIPWKTEDPVWVPQWPLTSEKLNAIMKIITEQLCLGHIEPSTSPWNTPIFVIKKKSGKWRLLHDLRAINAQMLLLGPVQRGLPLLTALPKGWPLLIIDIKDCFFSIPLHPVDRPRFAFTVPSLNHAEPDKRYQWKVLPQGMANSPTICQLFVDQALAPVKRQFPQVLSIHYMDDVLLCHQDLTVLQQMFPVLQKQLSQWGLSLATEKVQITDSGSFLGSVIRPDFIRPQKVEIRKDKLQTLNDFQKLLGDINWLRPFLKIPTIELKPLFDILEGDPHITSPRKLDPSASEALCKVEKAITQAQLDRIDYTQPILLCVLNTQGLPTAVVWQQGPLCWVHPRASPAKIVDWYPAAVAQLVIKGIKMTIEYFGLEPNIIISPYTPDQIQVLAATSSDWSVLCASFSGTFDNHYPRHPLLQFALAQPLVFPKITSNTPIKNGIVVYTDGSKTGQGAYVVNDMTYIKHFPESSPQVVECLVVLEVLQQFMGPLNIVSDSLYVVNAVKILETAGLIRPSSKVAHIFEAIRAALLQRRHPFFIEHIRAHSGLPGPMAKGNALADQATRLAAVALSSPIIAAKEFHNKFHVTSETLRRRFSLTRKEARDIVIQCQNCCQFLPVPHRGINPRGLIPLQVWQMDVTHYVPFGKLQYIHVSVDTCSGIFFATPLSGEKASHVIQHCLEAWSAWGKPRCLKTDNGPAYTSQKFKQFCAQMQVTHITGLPYNPQGQGIIERAHRTLKSYLLKQKGGAIMELPPGPRVAIAMSLFTLNFLNLDDSGMSAAERHCTEPKRPKEWVKWKDVLTNQWKGPDPILIRSRGAVCVFPQDEDNPFWVPERLIRKMGNPDDNDHGSSLEGNGRKKMGNHVDLSPPHAGDV